MTSHAGRPGLLVAAAYVASAAALVLLIRGNRSLVRQELVVFTALAGVTVYGIAVFSYFVQRSLTSVLPYVSLPAMLLAALWLSLLLRSRRTVSHGARVGGLVLTLTAALLVVAAAWSSIGTRFDRSALGHALPGGESLTAALDRLWDPPPLNPRSPAGESLLATYMPDESRSLILTEPDLGIEILLRSGRSSLLPLGDPSEDSYVPDERLPGVSDAIAELQPGDRLLLDQGAFDALAKIRNDPSYDPFTATLTTPGHLAPIEEWALQQIEKRFEIDVIHRGEQGLAVAQLKAR